MLEFNRVLTPLQDQMISDGYRRHLNNDGVNPEPNDLLVFMNLGNDDITIIFQAPNALIADVEHQNPATVMRANERIETKIIPFNKPSTLKLNVDSAALEDRLVDPTLLPEFVIPRNNYTLSVNEDNRIQLEFLNRETEGGLIPLVFEDADFQLDQLDLLISHDLPILKIGQKEYTYSQLQSCIYETKDRRKLLVLYYDVQFTDRYIITDYEIPGLIMMSDLTELSVCWSGNWVSNVTHDYYPSNVLSLNTDVITPSARITCDGALEWIGGMDVDLDQVTSVKDFLTVTETTSASDVSVALLQSDIKLIPLTKWEV